MEEVTVYVKLLNDGTDVWRPVQAEAVRDSVYRLIPPKDYDPSDEQWEFLPESQVECGQVDSTDGVIFAAIRAVQ